MKVTGWYLPVLTQTLPAPIHIQSVCQRCLSRSSAMQHTSSMSQVHYGLHLSLGYFDLSTVLTIVKLEERLHRIKVQRWLIRTERWNSYTGVNILPCCSNSDRISDWEYCHRLDANGQEDSSKVTKNCMCFYFFFLLSGRYVWQTRSCLMFSSLAEAL